MWLPFYKILLYTNIVPKWLICMVEVIILFCCLKFRESKNVQVV